MHKYTEYTHLYTKSQMNGSTLGVLSVTMLVLFHECFPLFHSNFSFISLGSLCVCHIFFFLCFCFNFLKMFQHSRRYFFCLFCERSHSVPWCTQHAVQCSVYYNIIYVLLLFSFVAVNDATQLDWGSKFFIIFALSPCVCIWMMIWMQTQNGKIPSKVREPHQQQQQSKITEFFSLYTAHKMRNGNRKKLKNSLLFSSYIFFPLSNFILQMWYEKRKLFILRFDSPDHSHLHILSEFHSFSHSYICYITNLFYFFSLFSEWLGSGEHYILFAPLSVGWTLHLEMIFRTRWPWIVSLIWLYFFAG